MIVMKPKKLRVRILTNAPVNKAALLAASRAADVVIDHTARMARERHQSGEGEPLPKTYTRSYRGWLGSQLRKGAFSGEAQKRAIAKVRGESAPDLTLTGRLWDKMTSAYRVRAPGVVEFDVYPRGWKNRDLGFIQKKWGVHVIGVTPKVQQHINDTIIRPLLQRACVDGGTEREVRL